MSLQEKSLKIKALVLDVDGVLTDGRIGYSGDSGCEIKFFDVRDGHGIKLALRAGLKVGILSGRRSQANEVRASELGLSFLYQGVKDKKSGLERLLEEQGLLAEECLYIGDDVVDIPPMRLSGIAVAVGNGVRELDAVCDFRTAAKGGRGAVRETIEWLLKERNQWNGLMQRYFS